MSLIKRNQQEKIEHLLSLFPVVLILGVRQSGKSTLSRMVRPTWNYFDLENSKDFEFITSDLDFFFREFDSEIVIDEAQEFPRLFKHLRGVIDNDRDRTDRFILTGSSSPELIQHASDSLAGRIGIVELGTCKMNELLEVPLSPFYTIFEQPLSSGTLDSLRGLQPISGTIDVLDLCRRGGFPGPVLKGDETFLEEWMEFYFQIYISRDISRLFPKLDRVRYRRFISMLSELSGTIINKAQVGRSLDISEVTVRDYLEIAHKTFIWRMIPSFEKTRVKSVTKMPKGILRDTGLLHYLSSVDSREKMLRSPNFGQNFESFIIEELIKGLSASPVRGWDYYYYRTKNGIEVDLVLDGRFGTLPIEIKSGSSTDISQLKSLRYFVESQDLPLGIVINNDTEVKMLHERIIQIPASCI